MYLQLLKSFNRLHPRAWDFIQLMRLDRPIGIYLLLWPTLWALWIAGDGSPSAKNVIIFVLGVVLMRSAGCAINDYADRNIDGDVARTKDRPIVTGRVTPKEALITAAVLAGLSYCLVLLTNSQTIAYDTYYAMSDREDDLKIGVKSTAVLFGDVDRYIILALQACALLLLMRAGQSFGLNGAFHIGLLGALVCFIWEFIHTRKRDAQSSLEAFLHNHWAGLSILLGIIAS